MGSGISTMPTSFTKQQAKDYAREKYDDALFDSLAVNGVLSSDKLEQFFVANGTLLSRSLEQNFQGLSLLKMIVPFSQDVKSKVGTLTLNIFVAPNVYVRILMYPTVQVSSVPI